MALVKITDMGADASVTGVELIAVSDGAAPKSVTITNIYDFVKASIEAIAALGAVDGSDFVLMLENGTDLKPTDLDNVAQHAIDTMWGKGLEAAPDAADIFLVKDGGATEKTMTAAVLAEYVRATIEAEILDVSDLADGSAALAGADHMLVTQGTTGKRITVANLNTFVYAGLAAHVTGLGALTTPADADELYILDSGTAKKMTLAYMWTYITGKIQGLTNKTPPVGPDILTVQDSAAGNALKEVTCSALWLFIEDTIQGLATKALPLDADILTIQDTADSDALKEMTFTKVWSWIEDHFQALAAKATPLAADILTIQDTADSDALKELTLGELKTHLEVVGTYKELWIPADLWSPAETTGPCEVLDIHEFTTNDISMAHLAFDGLAQDEFAFAKIVMPPDWDRSTVKAKVYWSVNDAAANVGEYVRFTLAGGSLADDAAIDAALGAAENMDDQVLAVNDMHVTPASSAITIGGTPALGGLINLQLSRDWDYAGAGAAMDVDAWVFGVLIQYKTTNTVAAW